ncbi:hypothetical protein FHR92_001410 [Fontibacillus solani]|uniref:Uncharacterized protein n=1 Tax=Fontibacillus solani TaxID=1572857 RepID=A0A7W3XQX0_9BACL|nr:hypothetical protein [Fontibacillus solani]MBA9084948.1 hypothetical protein [Fontibacillus solani]
MALQLQSHLQKKEYMLLARSEDIAEFIVSQLKLHPRVYVKTASMIAINPFSLVNM